ncbi:hypothetical protein P4475_09960 [Halalkalibacterium halodurans]|uniref:hypothetical protein n=1 Tax=Halalkalibacterium halodurans TaxID=86665 RepID=UPI002E22BB6D|nr:hypothetical protein [Halalkalibacterium halodurans]
MSRIENDFAKIISSPNNTKWRELKNVAEAYGCKAKPGAKHWKLYHELRPRPLTIPVDLKLVTLN